MPGNGLPAALGAYITAGGRLAQSLTAGDVEALRSGFGRSGPTVQLPRALADAQTATRAVALQTFLDTVAEHLERSGIIVHRLPLLLVPTSMLASADAKGAQDFVLGWNNVVIEFVDGGSRAEGFSSLLPAGDRTARQIFASAGVQLDLVAPLVRASVLGGGYRCASNQVRTNGQSSVVD